MDKQTLYKAGKNGTQEWSIWTEGGIVYTEFGKVGGKLQLASKKVTIKNVGKANQTSLDDQAESEALSILKTKKDKGYTEKSSGKVKTKYLLPMLAHEYKKNKDKVQFPCYVQPKLDGVRCIAFKDKDGEWVLYSRTGKEFPQPLNHIREDLKKLDFDGYLDGELYADPSVMTFEEITGAVRRGEYSQEADKLSYWIFDTISNDNYESRLESLCKAEKRSKSLKCSSLRYVSTPAISDSNGIDEALFRYLQLGYEGAIIRNADGGYEIAKRSRNLLKLKEFNDEEFRITSAKCGVGKDENAVIWVCQTKEGKTFDVRPRGTMDSRKDLWKNRENYYGKKLTVRYQNLTNDGIPRFPVGISVRDYE